MPEMVAGRGNRISGTLKPLSSLPYPEHQRLFNAENCNVSTDGRVFITGSTAVYEVLSAQDAGPESQPYKYCEYREIGVTTKVPNDCFKNGITTFGDYVYLACAHVPQWEQLSGLPEWGSPLNEISQTKPFNLIWLLMTQNVLHVESYIVRADLRKTPLQFVEYFKMPERCFANGLAADQDGNLYVANSVPGGSCIYKIDHKLEGAAGEDQHSPECVWSAPITHLVNGIKCKADSVYYTWNQLPGLPGVGRIHVYNDNASETIYGTIGFFDDFDVLDNGLIILANGYDFPNMSAILHFPQLSPGSLIFVSCQGEVFDVVKDKKLFHPSSVKVVHNSKVFAKGDIIVTDKGEHGEYAAFVFTPGDKCRSWFT